MAFFQELFCKHEYDSKTREVRHLNEDGSTHFPEIIIIQECKKCGKITAETLKSELRKTNMGADGRNIQKVILECKH